MSYDTWLERGADYGLTGDPAEAGYGPIAEQEEEATMSEAEQPRTKEEKEDG